MKNTFHDCSNGENMSKTTPASRLLQRLNFVAAGLLLAGAVHAQDNLYAVAIPAQRLDQALNALAAQTGARILFSTDVAEGRQAPALHAQLSAEQALQRLLANTGLRIEKTADGTYLVARPGSDTAVELGATQIQGAGLGSSTENSGSYTTGAMQTATKLHLSMRETPQAVTVITRQRLDDQALADLNDVVQNTPGLTLRRTGPQRSTYYARGFALDNLMYDGLPTSLDSSQLSQDLLSADMAMYDRVEIVRGATGLMQGAGNPAAAINLIRKRPTREFQASVEGSAGSWDRYRTETDISGPLNAEGSLRGRLVTAYQNQDSFRDSLNNERSLFYGIAEADLDESTTLTLSASRQQDNNNGNGWTGLPVGFDGSDLKLARSTSLSNDWEYWNKTSTSAYMALEHALDSGWKLNLAATRTWADLDMLGTYLLGRTATQTYDQYVGAGHYREAQNSFDAYASGPLRLFDRDHELVFGASHRRVVFNGDVPNNILLNSAIDVHDWDASATPQVASQQKYAWQNTNAKLNSVYASTRLSLADPLKLILGSRLDWYDNDTENPYRNTSSQMQVNRHVTRYAGLVYDLDAHHSVYVSYTDIFKPQSALDANDSIIAPITGKNYELGIKGEYFDGALNASAAIFQVDQDNRAKAVSDVSVCPHAPTTCYEAAGEVRSKGIELEVQGQLTSAWQLAAGYTFTEAKYRKDATAANVGRLFDTDIPRHQFKLTTSYTLPGALHQWRIGSSLYRQNRIYNTTSTQLTIEQDAYTLVDFMVGFKPTEHIDARLNLNNAFDTRYYNSISTSVTVPSNIYGDPRNLMLSVKYSF